jgi:hypothetical protein
MNSLYLFISIYLWLYSPCGPWPLFQFLNLYTVGRTPWRRDQPVARPLPAYRINTHRHPCLKWDSTPAFERAKTVHAIDRAATVTDYLFTCLRNFLSKELERMTSWQPNFWRSSFIWSSYPQYTCIWRLFNKHGSPCHINSMRSHYNIKCSSLNPVKCHYVSTYSSSTRMY